MYLNKETIHQYTMFMFPVKKISDENYANQLRLLKDELNDS